MNPLNKTGRPLRILPWAVLLLCLFTCADQAQATWSIVVTSTDTGEVAIGSATCVWPLNLKRAVGVIVVGKGAAQAQAWADIFENRQTMADGFLAGWTAEEIFAELELTDPQLQKHQYGIVDLPGGAVTFTGSLTDNYTGGVIGTSGAMAYAIQGNVLTGENVVLAAEEALLQTEGDLGQKIMAAMHAAKYFGGDGRCSCSPSIPDMCGSPPGPVAGIYKDKPRKTAHVAYLVIARMGDVDGEFSNKTGFANGSYYVDLNVTQFSNTKDPVDRLQERYNDFRASKTGLTDHLYTQKVVTPGSIPADGQSEAQLIIALADLDNRMIPHGNAAITVTHHELSAGVSTIGPVVDHGDGTYTVTLTAGETSGTDRFMVEVQDQLVPVGSDPATVLLYPFPTLEVIPEKNAAEKPLRLQRSQH